jgi:hypothetical protein
LVDVRDRRVHEAVWSTSCALGIIGAAVLMIVASHLAWVSAAGGGLLAETGLDLEDGRFTLWLGAGGMLAGACVAAGIYVVRAATVAAVVFISTGLIFRLDQVAFEKAPMAQHVAIGLWLTGMASVVGLISALATICLALQGVRHQKMRKDGPRSTSTPPEFWPPVAG